MIDLIIDCDPGQDDAIAILLALANKNFNILGITTVAGNVSVQQTFLNAKKICVCASREDIHVYKGASNPIKKELITAEHIHGENGLSCDISVVDDSEERKNAIQFIIDTLERSERKVTIAATAALTNLALAFQKAPHIKEKIDRIVLMGGSTETGNITEYAEFNFFTDPHAADIVFQSGVRIVMIGLNITHKVIFSETEINQIRHINNDVTNKAVKILEDLLITNKNVYGYKGGIVHDACVIAYLSDQSIFSAKDAYVCIETEDEQKIGRSVVDFSSNISNALVCVDVNIEKIFDLFFRLFSNYSSCKN